MDSKGKPYFWANSEATVRNQFSFTKKLLWYLSSPVKKIITTCQFLQLTHSLTDVEKSDKRPRQGLR